MIKTIIITDEGFNDKSLLFSTCDLEFKNESRVEIVSEDGDGLAFTYSQMRGKPLTVFHTDTTQMIDYSDMLIAFWDGKNRKTKFIINTCRSKGLKIKVVMYGNK